MRNHDRGSATVWAAMAACAMCAVFAVVLAMGQAVVARHRAGAAADLAALAAADRALEGAAQACVAAAGVARAQGADLVRCAVDGEIADVTARAALGPYAPEVRSRAGPPGSLGPSGPPDGPLPLKPSLPGPPIGPTAGPTAGPGAQPGPGPPGGGR
ncbi:flp pilus-assembly TadE/G-like family protein [Streptomyces sp. NBC_01619]|uniref:Rv3654c family TadE-like protein n=1 Tax=Streptomyces pratisoli TaxID=3139917 RepID=A0ACC6QKR3_9ACTN|nr:MULTISPECIES: Rv3654c family TadE-like protein [unclassified Streptomyces]MCX4512347.1 flp pilus-assembly TadE/G-like family protein [Streptomyces sp. NBC_01619]